MCEPNIMIGPSGSAKAAMLFLADGAVDGNTNSVIHHGRVLLPCLIQRKLADAWRSDHLAYRILHPIILRLAAGE